MTQKFRCSTLIDEEESAVFFVGEAKEHAVRDVVLEMRLVMQHQFEHNSSSSLVLHMVAISDIGQGIVLQKRQFPTKIFGAQISQPI